MEPTASVKLWWNDTMDEKLKAGWAAGDSMALIGYEVGRSRCSVAGRIKRLGLPKRRTQDNANAPVRLVIRRRPRLPELVRQVTQRLHIRPGQAPVVATHTVYEGAHHEAPSTRKTLLELGPDDCRWPCWNDGDAEKFFCGAPQAGLSYCAHHCAIAYNHTPRLTRAREEFERAA